MTRWQSRLTSLLVAAALAAAPAANVVCEALCAAHPHASAHASHDERLGGRHHGPVSTADAVPLDSTAVEGPPDNCCFRLTAPRPLTTVSRADAGAFMSLPSTAAWDTITEGPILALAISSRGSPPGRPSPACTSLVLRI